MPTFDPSRVLPIRMTFGWNGPRWTWLLSWGIPLAGIEVETARKSDRLSLSVAGTIPVPVLFWNVSALTSALAPGCALIAATTWAAVLESAPDEFVARRTVISFTSAETLSGEFAAPGFTNWALMSLPPWWPQARDVRTTRLALLIAVAPNTVPLAGRFALSRVPSAWPTWTVGIVVPGSAVPPGAVGAPGTLFTMTTAIAPACCALNVLSAKLQFPRSTSAIEPAGNPVIGPQPSLGVPVVAWTSA